jgi:Mn-dependent DtxR family transcriptional regulator
MATVKTYDVKCHELAKLFLSDHLDLNTEKLAHMLALEIQQVCEDEITFMRAAPDLYQ